MGAADSPPLVMLAIDAAGAMPAAATLRSIATSQDGPLDIAIMGLGLSPAQESRLAECAGPHRLEVLRVRPELLDGLPRRGHLPSTAFLRLLGPRLLGAGRERILYLDNDTVVLDRLDPLLSWPMPRHPLAAVQVPSMPHVSSPGAVALWRELALPPRTPMPQTGVLLIDVDWWLAEDLDGRILDFARRRSDSLRYLDQDATGAIVAGRFHRLPLRWNQLPGLRSGEHLGYSLFDPDEVAAAESDPAIMHFAGSLKPWNSLRDRDPGFGIWRDIIAQTPYADEMVRGLERLQDEQRRVRRRARRRRRSARWRRLSQRFTIIRPV